MSLFDFRISTEDEVELKVEMTGDLVLLTIKGDTEADDRFIELNQEEADMLGSTLKNWSYAWNAVLRREADSTKEKKS